MSNMKFSPRTGQVSLDAGEFIATNGTIRLRSKAFVLESTTWKWKGNATQSETTHPGLVLRVAQQDTGLAFTIINRGSDKIELQDLTIDFPPSSFSPAMDAGSCVQMRQGEVPLMEAGVFPMDRKPAADPENPGYTMTVYHDRETGRSLLMGVVGRADCGTSFRNLYADAHCQGNFGFSINFSFDCELRPGARISTPRMVVLAGNDPLALLDAYGLEWKRRVKPRTAPRVTGWNSWDFYGGSVSQAVIRENLSAMRRSFPNLKHLIIDDGWQQRWGEWDTLADRFPRGARGLARNIRENGAVPGIWIAPYTMYQHCPFAFNNRDCLVKDAKGHPVMITYSSGPVVLLDPTHPKVRKYIQETFRFLERAGFRYFKLDFTQALLDRSAVKFHDPTKTRMQIMTMALDHIRKAVKPKTYILSGTFPTESLAGRVEAARIANDIHSFWSHVSRSAWQVAAAYWMHGNLFNNDPDFLIVRSATTSKDEDFNYIATGEGKNPVSPTEWWTRGRLATEEELRVWATIVLLAGGEVIAGDRLRTLNAKGRAMIHTVLENLADTPAVPLDMFDAAAGNTPPAYWLGQSSGRPMLGIINWHDTSRTFGVDLPELGISASQAIELWNRKQHKFTDSTEITLAPHSSVVFRFQ